MELELSGTLQTEAFIAPTGDTQAGALGSSRMFVVVVHGAVLFRSSLPRLVSLARNFSGTLNCGTRSRSVADFEMGIGPRPSDQENFEVLKFQLRARFGVGKPGTKHDASISKPVL